MVGAKDFYQGVLVVDDEPLVLKYTTSVISRLGCGKVFQAKSADAARAVLCGEAVSLMICDVSLPDGDGRDLLAETMEKFPHMAGVLITGFATDDLKLPAGLAERIRLLQKPFLADDISHVLAELIDRRDAAAVPV